jgi:hypothetical protein
MANISKHKNYQDNKIKIFMGPHLAVPYGVYLVAKYISSHTWISRGADFVKFSSTLGVGSGTTGADRGTTGATAEPHKN